MCGLIAALTVSQFSEDAADRALSRMARRGPDGKGMWWGEGVFLGHRRLAILDLDARAAQPMHSDCGRYVIVFNGEIYNFRELKEGLEALGEVFHTTSDTEVILKLFAAEGETMLSKLHGMFAFVVWDKLACKAFAARDPYGIKPLYFGQTATGVILASQVKALLATGQIDMAPDERGQAGYWMLGSVPEPHTWFRDIQALPAGHCLWIEDCRVRSMRCWYDISAAWRNDAQLAISNYHKHEVSEQVREALNESMARHMVADVPVGVFLSGGIDSGALAGLMRGQGVSSLHGITIAYDEYEGSHWDEAPVASEIAHHYRVTHHVRKVGRDEFLSDLPRILDAMDQPTIDGINTWYASKAAAEQGLKVVVSGVGGDEMFLGYKSFRQLPMLVTLWRALLHLPGTRTTAQWVTEMVARRTHNARWRHAPEWLQDIAGAWWLSRSLQVPDDVATHTYGKSYLNKEDLDPGKWVEGMTGDLAKDLTLALAQIESTTYLRNQLLRDSDWASMDHSIELRTPLVDSHLLTTVQPLLSQFSRFPRKTLLARAPTTPLPMKVIRRSKTGFGIPLKQWTAEMLEQEEISWQSEVARLCYR